MPLDARAADFPWREIGRRRSKVARRGEQVDAIYSPQLALTRVATYGDDEGEEAGEYRSDGGWISVGAGRPYVPPHLSLEEATERLRRHMPNVRASKQASSRCPPTRLSDLSARRDGSIPRCVRKTASCPARRWRARSCARGTRRRAARRPGRAGSGSGAWACAHTSAASSLSRPRFPKRPPPRPTRCTACAST